MATLRLALRMLLRDWRAGELRVLIAAIVLAVASVGTVGFFARSRQGRRSPSRRIDCSEPTSWCRAIVRCPRASPTRRGRSDSRPPPAIRFNSMVQRAGGVDAGRAAAGAAGAGAASGTMAAGVNAVLTDVKAVSAGYPLRGSVTLVLPGNPAGRVARGIPPPGEAWIDRKLADRLDAQVGSRLAVGDASLKVTAIIAQDPEVAGLTFAPGPKLLLNLADVPSTNLLQPGNRATWRLLVAQAGGGGLERYRAWLAGAMQPGQRVETVRDLRPEVRQTLERAERFLGLAALVAVLLAAVAVALAASRYLRRHLDAAAMIRCFGASVARTLALFVIQFLVLGLVASAAGIACALAGQQLLVALVSSSFSDALPWPSWVPALSAFATGMLLLLGFALPPLVALARVPPLRVLRRDLPRPRAAGVIAYACGTLAIGVLIAWQAREAQAAYIVIGGVAGLLIAAAAVAWLLLALLKRVPQGGVSWRFGLANLRRRPLASSLQIGCARPRTDVAAAADRRPRRPAAELAREPAARRAEPVPGQRPARSGGWRARAGLRIGPRGAGIQADGPRSAGRRERRSARRGALQRSARSAAGRARIQPVVGRSPAHRQSRRRREVLGPTGAGQRRGHLARGWHREDAGRQARRPADLRLRRDARRRGDHQPAQGRLGQLSRELLRAVRARCARRPSGHLHRGLPGARRQREPGCRRWSGAFPTSSPSTSRRSCTKCRAIIDRVARAIEFVFLFTLAGGLLVLQAAIASTQDERRHDAAVLRTLGASRRQLQSAQATEFVILGALAGLLAAAGAIAIGWVLADRVFNIPFSTDPLIWV